MKIRREIITHTKKKKIEKFLEISQLIEFLEKDIKLCILNIITAGLVVHICNSSSEEAEAGDHGEFEASLSYKIGSKPVCTA